MSFPATPVSKYEEAVHDTQAHCDRGFSTDRLWAAHADAQDEVVTDRAIAVEVSQQLRSGKPASIRAVHVLAQLGAPVDGATIAALAESLVVIATAAPNQVSMASRERAISLLGLAGASVDGVPYAGSARALYRIATQPRNPARSRAIASMAKLRDYDSVEKYLAAIGAPGQPEGGEAIYALYRAMESAGRSNAALRRMWESSMVHEKNACYSLRSVAAEASWDPTPATSCLRIER